MDAGSLFLALSKLLPILVFPLCFACIVLLISLVAPLRPSWRRALGAAALALLLVASCSPVAREIGRTLEWQYLPPAELPAADAIVLLGGALRPAVFPRTEPELDEAASRVRHAARLYRAGKAPMIHVAGGRFDLTGTLGPEAPETASLLAELGVPRDAMLLENDSRSTYENATAAWRMLAPRGVKRILLVTSALHMPRSVGLFRHQGFDVIPAPTDFHVVEYPPSRGTPSDDAWILLIQSLPQAETLAYTTRVLREWMGIVVYRMRGLLD